MEAFDFEKDEWEIFKEQLEQLFEVNSDGGSDAADLRKERGILLNVCTKWTFELLRTLSTPDKPSQKTFDELCALLKERCLKKPLLVMRRLKFHSRNCMKQESVTEYVTTLRNFAAAECDFTDVTDHLCHRLVCGINIEMQRQMLTAEKLDLQKAVSIAMIIASTE